MNRNIRLSFGNEQPNSTTISNNFIDYYMADANGAYVKVYIYLLRCLSDPCMMVSIAAMADKLDETENDIKRALRYWEKKKLLSLKTGPDKQIYDITIMDLDYMDEIEEETTISYSIPAPKNTATYPEAEAPKNNGPVFREAETPREPVKLTDIAPATFSKPSYTARQMAQMRQIDDFNNLIDYIEEKLGTPMNHKALQTPAFLYENMAMSSDLIRFLYDYCISKNKKSSAYIEKIARNWAEQGIDTVSKAKHQTLTYSLEYKAVCSAFGIKRDLGSAELDYISKWFHELGMTDKLINASCSRTILSTGKPDFNYADRILENWHKNGVKTLDDVKSLDELHNKRSTAAKSSAGKSSTAKSTNNKFAQFPQRERSEDEYSSIERKLLGKN